MYQLLVQWPTQNPCKTKTHFIFCRGDEWGTDSGHNCHNETLPIVRDGYWGEGSDTRYMHVVESTIQELKQRGVNVRFLNTTQLSEYRKDAHPSIYRKQWDPLTEEQLKNQSSYADCIHWCLPGVPDIWNQILYAHIFSWTERFCLGFLIVLFFPEIVQV